MDLDNQRPEISEYEDPSDYFRAMLRYRKTSDPDFSISRASLSLRRVSPALVSLISKGQRRITLDRVEELSKLLSLSSTEKIYLYNWIENLESGPTKADLTPESTISKKRKDVGVSLLNDWINVYVKDLFQIPEIQKKPTAIYKQLASVASIARINRSIRFLMREGHLRKTPEGKIVVDTPLTVADPQIPSEKIRKFHKGALKLAQAGIDLYPAHERLANTMTVPLNKKSYQELMSLIDDFAEKLKHLAERDAKPGDRLYQLIVNVSPVGGKKK